MNKLLKPPKWPDRFLGWYCSPRVREQVQGDAHELFYWRLEEKGELQARRAFAWDVIRLFKWSNIKRTRTQKLNNVAMFKNYFKIGLRNLWKQRMPSTINIIGLSLAVGCCIVAFKWIESRFYKDRFHENADQIYMLTSTRIDEGDFQRYGVVSLDVSKKVVDRIPAVEQLVRYNHGYGRIKSENASFGNFFGYADPNLFEVFTFQFIEGDPMTLRDPRTVVIDEAHSKAYYGNESALGKIITIEIDGQKEAFTIGAVMENPPDNSSFQTGVIVNFEHFEKSKDPLITNSWAFTLLNSSSKANDLGMSLESIIEDKNLLTPKSPYEKMGLLPLSEVATSSREMHYGFGGTPPMAPIVVLSCIGAFMLLLSTFNYINISTVMAMKRIKEIGVRKVIGGKRTQLIVQFLTENLLLCTLSIFVGCLLASTFFLPGFNGIAGSNLTLDLFEHRNLWYFLGMLLVFITIASGAYPALYVSGFKPTVIFRGDSIKGGKRRLTSFLLAFQMTLAVITIVAGVMFVHTNSVNESREWGYDQYSKLVVSIPPTLSYSELKAEFEKLPNVLEVAGSRGNVGNAYESKKVTHLDNELYTHVFYSESNYAEMLGLELTEGSFFDKEAIVSNQNLLVVNETFAEQLGIEISGDPVVVIDSTNFRIQGIVKDFHFTSFSDVIRPAVFQVVSDSLFSTASVQVTEGTVLEMKSRLTAIMNELDPENVHNVFPQESVFDAHFEEMNGIRNIMIFTASLCVLLSAMGLFGLVSLNISARLKDLSIRKVLGASLSQLSKNVYRRFAIILVSAIVVGGTLSVFVIEMLLDSVYGYHEPINVIPVSLAGLILLAVAFLTINTQIKNIRRLNPAETLRNE